MSTNQPTAAALKPESAVDARTRQLYNRKVALLYARHGIAVFPSSGDGKKTPLVKRFTVLDKNVTDEDRKAAEAEHKASGRPLVHIGSTTSAAAIIKLWNAYPDAVPSISTGANGLLVVDPDRKKNGPRCCSKRSKNTEESQRPAPPDPHHPDGIQNDKTISFIASLV